MANKTTAPAATEQPYLNADGSVLTSDPRFHTWKHPRYLEANDKVNELKLKFVEVEKDIQQENARIYSDLSMNRHMMHAEALAYGKPRPEGSPAADLKRLYDEGRILETAIQLAEKRRSAVESEVTREICKEASKSYIRIIERTLPLLQALADVDEIERKFVDALLWGGTTVDNLLLVARLPFQPRLIIEYMVEEAKREYGLDINKPV